MGRNDDTDEPLPDPKPKPTPKPVPDLPPGPIRDRWRQLGGSGWGVPKHLPASYDDGRGQRVGFRQPSGVHKNIVWTAQTGARVTFGHINAYWAVLGGHRSPLGYPISDDSATHDGVGRCQRFEGGLIVYHPETGSHEVRGPILARYDQLGGSAFGYPVGAEADLGDGRGRFMHFKELPSGAIKGIYWSPSTGAHPVYGLIEKRWSTHKSVHGFLGYPTSGEMATHDGVGRYQTFEGGQIVWHPQTGAHEVHGDILTRYGQLGGSAFGYPTTDEGDIGPYSHGRPIGRFNHFKQLPGGAVKGIYWSPTTGAHPVSGPIDERWRALGYTGYRTIFPTTGENATHDGVGRYQTFEGGLLIVWHPQTGAHAVDHSAIRTRYGQLGGSRFGYPINDGGQMSDGRGRFSHFRDIPSGAIKHIHWTSTTGAHEIFGPIEQRWSALGFVNGPLGYPTTGPVPLPNGGKGEMQSFEGGQILHYADGTLQVNLKTPTNNGGGGSGGTKKPDLQFTSAARHNVKENRVEIDIKNAGSADAAPFRLNVQIDGKRLPDDVVFPNGLKAGETAVAWFTPGVLDPNISHSYNFALDTYNTVAESNEDNNAANGYFDVTAP